MSTHFKNVCDEHGTILGQCRCPDPAKSERKVPCQPGCPEYVKVDDE